MAKPDVQISAPTRLIVGHEVAIEIDVTAERETKVDFIEAAIEGRQGWSVGSGKSQVSHRTVFPKLVSQLMGPGILPAAATTRFAMRFQLPPGTAPSHDIDPAYAKLVLRIHISIPWRIDGRYHYEFGVRLPPPPRVERVPYVIRSTTERSPADEPRIELSLASTRLIAGEACVGSLAVFHVDDRKPREVELSFVPNLTLHGRGGPRDRRGTAYTATITLPPGSAGTSVPFEISVPTVCPSFQTVTHEVKWWLVAMTGSFFSRKLDVSVPLEIVDAAARSTTPRLNAPPRLGDERIAAIFATAAAKAGWRGDDLKAEEEGQFAIARDTEAGELSIAYAYRGEDGTFVITRVEHPSLGLGLSVAPSSSLRHVFWKDLEVDIAAWDRAHHVGARSQPQAVPFLQAVVPGLMRCGRLGALVRWDDAGIVFERPMSTIDERELAAMIATLEPLAPILARARAAITPPPDVALDLDAWRDLAKWLDAELVVGDLSMTGMLDQLPVTILLEWEAAKPARICVAVGSTDSASEQLARLALLLPRPASDVLGAPDANDLVESVTRWPNQFVDLRVEQGIARAACTLVGAPPVVEPLRIRELVQGLRGVLATLSPATGPYR